MTLRPFWRYFGGKWRAAPRYPAPLHRTIVEPFAGSAGYALRFADREVVLVEKNPVIAEVWRFLIGASRREIERLPPVERLDELPASTPEGARYLIGLAFGAGDTRPRQAVSPMVRRDGGWARLRDRCADQVESIKHWRIVEGDYTAAPDVTATWFVDPPYHVAGGRAKAAKDKGRVRYPFGADAIDFAALGTWCRERRGQVLVCEQAGASWLPFEPLGLAQTVGRGHAGEAFWTNGRTP